MTKTKNKTNIFNAIFSVTTIVLVVKIIGFLKQIITAYVFGTTIETDLISLSQGLIGEFDFFITHALITALTAIYIKNKENEEESKDIVSGVFKIFVPISLVFSTVFFFASPLFAKLIAPSYDDTLQTRLSTYIKIFAPLVVLQILISISSAVLTANKRFLWQQLIGLNQSIFIISIVLIFQEQLGIWTLVIGFCAAAIFNVFFTGIPAKKYWSINIRNNPFKNTNVVSILKMMLPLLIGYAMIYINQIVDKILSSGLEDGSVTALSYSSILINLVLTFVTSILSVFFVYITSNISKNNHEKASDLVMNATILLISIFLPISLLICLCNEDVVTIVYMRGAFNERGVYLTSQALLGYGICIVPYCIRELFARYLYGYEDSKHPMINSCIGILINIVISIVLSQYIGILGIAIGSSISDIVCAILNVVVSKKKTRIKMLVPLLKSSPFFVIEVLICIAAFLIGKYAMQNINIWIRFISIALIGFVGSMLAALPILKKVFYAIKEEKNQEEVLQ